MTIDKEKENGSGQGEDGLDGASLLAAARAYVERCAETSIGVKGRCRFPNLAGFCATLGMGVEELRRMLEPYPEVYGTICALLEDAALNWEWSATLVSAYLKMRLGYGEKPEETRSVCETEQTRIVFEHDILEDGE